MEPYRSLHMYSDVLVVVRSVPRTLLNLDPRDADPPPSTLQPTQSFLETAGKSLTLYMIGSSRLHREMSETSRVEMDELPASIPWIVFDKARTVVKLFHTRSVASQFQFKMVGVQEGVGSYVSGFTFNLGFSKGLFSHGDPLEVEGSKEIVRVAEKFWWFEHMYKHLKSLTWAQRNNFTQNIAFARVRGVVYSGLAERCSLKWSL